MPRPDAGLEMDLTPPPSDLVDAPVLPVTTLLPVLPDDSAAAGRADVVARLTFEPVALPDDLPEADGPDAGRTVPEPLREDVVPPPA